MWFQLQLTSTAKLTGMVTPLGELVWRLSDIGRLLNKSNPHVWGLKFRGLTPRHFLPELFHSCFTEMVLRTHVLKSPELETILKLQSPELSHYLSWFFKEGRVEVEKGSLDHFNVHTCIRARAHPQGMVWVRDFLEHVKQKACAFYRELERRQWIEAQERRESVPGREGPLNGEPGPSREGALHVKEEPLEGEPGMEGALHVKEEPLDGEPGMEGSLHVKEEPLEEEAGMEGHLHVKEEPLEECLILLDPSQTLSVNEDSQAGPSREELWSGGEAQAGPSRVEPQMGSMKEEPGERVETSLIKKESQAKLPVRETGEQSMVVCQGEQKIMTIYLPEDRYKLDVFLKVERQQIGDQELML